MRHEFLDHHSKVDSPIHRLDPRVKVTVFFSFILIGVSTNPHSLSVFAVLAAGLTGITLIARLPVFHLAKKLLLMLPFLLVVAAAIPFTKKGVPAGGYSFGLNAYFPISMSGGGLWIFWNVLIKSCIGVFSIILLYSTTPFSQLIKGLERMGLPRIFTILLAFMYRYSFLLTDEVHRMKRARDSRSFGNKWLWHLATMGHMIGVLFLRSYHRSERVYLAMLSRGYQGTMPGVLSGRFGRREFAFASLIPFLLFVRLFWG